MPVIGIILYTKILILVAFELGTLCSGAGTLPRQIERGAISTSLSAEADSERYANIGVGLFTKKESLSDNLYATIAEVKEKEPK